MDRRPLRRFMTGRALLVAVVSLAVLPLFAMSPAWEALDQGFSPKEAAELFEREWEGAEGGAETALGYSQALLLLGEREKAFVVALEGLRRDPGDPLAFQLLDMVGEDALLNQLTAKLTEEVIHGLMADDRLHPHLRIRMRLLLLRLAAGVGDAAKLDERRTQGTISGAFFSRVKERLTRIEYLKAQPGEGATFDASGFEYLEGNGPLVRPPLYRMGDGGEVLFVAVFPFQVESDCDALFHLNSARSFKASLDGVVLAEKNMLDEQVAPSALVRVHLEKGLHRLSLKVHAGGKGDGVNVMIADSRGEPLSFKTVKDPAAAVLPTGKSSVYGEIDPPYPAGFPASDPRKPAIDALYRRWLGDVAGARIDMEKVALEPGAGLLWRLWAVRLYLFEAEDLPAKIAESRAERALSGALEASPGCPMARFYNALLVESQSDSGEELKILGEILSEAPGDPRWGLKLAERMLYKGWRSDSMGVLEQVSSRHPDSPAVCWAWIDYMSRVPDRPGQMLAIKRLEKVANALEAYENYYFSTSEWAPLKAVIEKQAAFYGDADLTYARKLAGIKYRSGSYAEAMGAYEKLIALDPRDEESAVNAARCAFLSGDRDAGMKELNALRERRPGSFQAEQALWMLGEPIPFEDGHLSLERVLAEDKSDGPEEAPSSLVLDQLFTRVYRDGSSLERYHCIVKINNKSGVDREGEQALQGHMVLCARTVKADGTVLEPEQIPEKRTLSMPGLEAGDLVELEYITFRPPNRIKESTYITSQVFLFQDIDRPFHRTQWRLEYPLEMKLEIVEKNLPQPATRAVKGGLNTIDWDYRSMPRIVPEPNMPNRYLFVPMVEVVGGLSNSDIHLFLKDGVIGSFQVTPELKGAYDKDIAGGAPDQDELLSKIINFSLEQVEGDRGGDWGDPTQTLLNRAGNRIPLVGALLQIAGIKWDLLLAEPVPNNVFSDNLPRLGQFILPVLRVGQGGKSARYLMLTSPYRDRDILPWYLQGARALELTGANSPKTGSLEADFGPWRGALEEEKRKLLPCGDLEISHSQIMDPDTGEALRSTFHSVPKEQWEQLLQMGLSRQHGSADLKSFDIKDFDDAEAPFGWTYELLVKGYAVPEGDKLLVAEPLPALHLTQSLASLEKRKLPLAPDGPLFMNQRFILEIPEGYGTDYEPGSLKLGGPFGRYRLSCKRDGRKFTFERSLEIPYKIISPQEYGAFAAFLEKIDKAEAGQMVLSPAGGRE